MKPGLRLDTRQWDKYIKKVGAKADRDLELLVAQTTQNISVRAKRVVSFVLTDQGGLVSSIRSRVSGKNGEVKVGVNYGPFVEFGTGSKVKVPAELREYAMQFKGKGIRKVNLGARPYFYPGFFIERAKFLEKLKKLI